MPREINNTDMNKWRMGCVKTIDIANVRNQFGEMIHERE